jgi:quinol monooxygenase YgiN
MSVTRINTFEARDGEAGKLHAFIKSFVPVIEGSQGCESCQVLRSQEDPNQFLVIERWSSVDAHKESLKNIPADFGLIKPMLANPPHGSYFTE